MRQPRRRHWLVGAVHLAIAATLVAGAIFSGGNADAARKRASPRLVQDLSNTTPLQIPNGGQSSSSIVVSGFETDVADVDVTVRNLNHNRVGELDLLLLGPGGETAVFLSDVGTDANNVTLTLDDGAPGQVPSASPLANGTFQPSNFASGDGFTPPAPPITPSGSELGVFNSTDPNGAWTLIVRDDDITGSITGSLNGGWSLRIVSANGVPDASPESFTVKAGKSLNELGGVLENDRDPDNDPLTASLAGQPGKGQVQLQPDGSFTYKAKKKAKGKDSFTYLAQDPGGLSDLETVSIKIKKHKKHKKHKKKRRK